MNDVIKISYGDTFITATRGEVLAAAQDGLTVYDRDGDAYRLAANWRGWCTLVNHRGNIFHGWAGEFSTLPPVLREVIT